MEKINKKFFGKVLLLIFFIWLIDSGSGLILDHLYASSKAGVSFQEYYIVNKTSQELLIFGSSRAAYHYVPDIFSNELKMSTYNVGREGTGIYFHNAVLVSTLKRYNPKLIILDLDFRDIYARGGNFGPDVFKELAPFYGKINHEFDSLLTRNWYDPVFYSSSMFRYNKKFFNVLTGNLVKGRENFNGYRPLVGVWDQDTTIKKDRRMEIDPDMLHNIESFIRSAQRKKIGIIISLSPSNKVVPDEFYTYIHQISEKLNVPVIDHFSDTTFLNNPDLFYDEEHLNSKGAEEFSVLVSGEINKLVGKSSIE